MGRRALALSLLLAIVAYACGDDDGSSSTTAESAAFPVIVRGTEIPAQPTRIVSLSATHTEILYEIGAGAVVVGTDLFSDYPAAANETEKIDSFNLSVEAVSALDPDLVILAFDPGEAVSGLDALGIPAVLFAPPGPADIDEVYAEIRDVGLATGLADEAEALVTEMSDEIEAVLASVPETDRGSTFFIELDPTLFTAGAGSLIDSIFGSLGLENVATPDDGAFPQFSPESLVGTDPDFVFLADTLCCSESADTFGARPGFGEMSAVQNGNVVPLDDSVVSRWGPRLVELYRTIATEVYGI